MKAMLHAATYLWVGLFMMACAQEMRDQPYLEPMERSSFFEDGMGSRPAVPGTVSREEGRYFVETLTGKRGDAFLEETPLAVDRSRLQRGRERYAIYCVPCHGDLGKGDGAVVARGFPAPPSLLLPRLREARDGYLYHVITNGYGIMYPYGNRIEVEDRWAIVSYLRVLQRAGSIAEERRDQDAGN